jgi:hypothetical protein
MSLYETTFNFGFQAESVLRDRYGVLHWTSVRRRCNSLHFLQQRFLAWFFVARSQAATISVSSTWCVSMDSARVSAISWHPDVAIVSFTGLKTVFAASSRT